MKKKLAIVAAILVALAVIAGGLFYQMTKPLYAPGAVAQRDDLDPVECPEDEPGWCVTSDVRLAHFSAGEGRPVLYVHGGPGVPQAGTAPAFDLLGAHARVHYYAQRGTGESTRLFSPDEHEGIFEAVGRLDRALGIAEQLADIERIRRILGEEKLLLIGHSYGGFLATMYAAEFPDRVEKLVLLAPAALLVMPSDDGDLFGTLRARLPESRRPAFDAWLEEYLDLPAAFERSESELLELDAKLMTFWVEVMGAPPESAAPARPGPWMTRAQFFGLGMRHDYRAALSAIEAPTLVIHGTADLQPRSVAEGYAAGIADAEVVDVTGAGHFMHHSHAHEVGDLVAEHFDMPAVTP